MTFGCRHNSCKDNPLSKYVLEFHHTLANAPHRRVVVSVSLSVRVTYLAVILLSVATGTVAITSLAGNFDADDTDESRGRLMSTRATLSSLRLSSRV